MHNDAVCVFYVLCVWVFVAGSERNCLLNKSWKVRNGDCKLHYDEIH